MGINQNRIPAGEPRLRAMKPFMQSRQFAFQEHLEWLLG